MKAKRVITIFLAAIMLFSLASCDNISRQPKKEFGEYPDLPKGGGYTVTGKVTDQKGNPLPNAIIMSGDKVRGVTDKNGEYKIAGLEGEVTLKPSFSDYTFDKKEAVVTGEGEVVFVGKNSYTASASVSDGKSTLYQMSFVVDNKRYDAKDSDTVYFDGRNGLTRITPVSDSFDFEPSYKDIYDGQHVEFTAKPKSGTFSVKGKIDLSGLSKEEREDIEKNPQVYYITVDGKKYSSVITEYTYTSLGESSITMRYEVKGLINGKSYTVGIVDGSGNAAAESYSVKEDTDNLDFKLKITRKLNFTVRPLNIKTKFGAEENYNEKKLDYVLVVKDENGNEVFRRGGDYEGVSNVPVWAGCTVYITKGEYYEKKESETIYHFMFDDWLPITPAMIRDNETDTYEITFVFTDYKEEE